jgi:hypothetical protein
MKDKQTEKVPSLLSVNADAKTSKGMGKGWLTGICYLAPVNVAGMGNVCPHASPACRAACLFTAGRAALFPAINLARIARTRFLFRNRNGFRVQLEKEISALVRKAERDGLTPAVRLNGTSDLPFFNLFPGLMESFPNVRFYDYTKNPERALAFAKGKLPANYHLTFSLSETNADLARKVLKAGVNVASVVDKPDAFADGFNVAGETFETFDADASDLRFLDPVAGNGRGRVGLLKAKGRAKADRSGFVTRA